MKKFFLFFLPLLSLDSLTKFFAIQHIPLMESKFVGYPYGGIAVFDWQVVSFSLNTVYNSGAAWGIFQGNSGALFIVRAAIIAGLLFYLISMQRKKPVKTGIDWHSLPLWLVTIGALGNSIDYLAYGQVVDFLHFCFWEHTFPVFNLADSYITIGVFALLLAPRKTSLHISTL